MILIFQEFISAGVNAYALGCTDEGLRKELFSLKESGVEIEAMETYGGSTSLKSKILSEEVSHFCIAQSGVRVDRKQLHMIGSFVARCKFYYLCI